MSEKKNIVITGGARGIGRATARHLALLGHRLFLIDIDIDELSYTANKYLPGILRGQVNGTEVEATEVEAKATEAKATEAKATEAKATEAKATEAKATEVNGTEVNGTEVNGTKPPTNSSIGHGVCDLRDPAAVRSTIEAAAEFFGGRIDVLVNNAGIARAQFSGGRSMAEASVLDEWQAYMETNLTAPFVVSQACIPHMKIEDEGRKEHVDSVIRPEAAHSARDILTENDRSVFSARTRQSPCIINIASFRARQSEPNCEGYAASKGGILGLTQAMSISCAQWGIRCNAILPGYIYVMHECREADEKEGVEWWAKGVPAERHRKHPTGRIGCGEDVAETIEWLMGAGFVTGQEIVVDGGMSKIKHVDA
ncbi:hypothetical protein Daus18300_003424 [Diaporthe australafricana]|uniref:Uncharacterized protein n=1 Tax=Diaporthe australafricana TaxID=127596 RepID=A0ABR3XG13_9PEZI